MIELKIVATSVADLNTQLMNMLGIYPTCDECSNEEEEYSCDCEECKANREVEAPDHFIDWLFNTTYHDTEGFAISISKAYDEYFEYYKVKCQEVSLNEEPLDIEDFTGLMLDNGFYLVNTDCDSFFVLDETYAQ
jgi:hypothetical protein